MRMRYTIKSMKKKKARDFTVIVECVNKKQNAANVKKTEK
jgi:hypothetical protein